MISSLGFIVVPRQDQSLPGFVQQGIKSGLSLNRIMDVNEGEIPVLRNVLMLIKFSGGGLFNNNEEIS